jgi:hypothetical protein
VIRTLASAGRLCAVAALLVLMTTILSAQNPVTVILRPPPPNQLKVADLWEITLINSGRTALTVYLKGSVTEQKDGLVATATSSPFSLPPGTKIFTAKNISQLSPVNTSFKNPRYEDIINAIGSAPSGTYDICIEVYPSGVAAGMLASNCVNSHTVESTSQPLLLSPQDAGDVPEARPMLTWAMPTPLRARAAVTYSVRIVQLLGKQSPTAAMQANPAWMELNDLTTTTIQYPPGARPLVTGSTYAWKVSAFMRGALLGESEVWRFVFSPAMLAVEVSPPVKTAKKKNLTINVLEELLQSCSDQGVMNISTQQLKK